MTSLTNVDSVEELAQVVRDVYIECAREHLSKPEYGRQGLPLYDVGKSAWSRNRADIEWPKLARFFLQESLDPRRVIPAVFQTWKRGEPPAPNYFRSNAAKLLYLQEQEAEPHRLATRFHSQYRNFEDELYTLAIVWEPQGKSVVEMTAAVLDGHNSLDPIFRYCLAKRAGLDELAAKHYEAALTEYFFRRRGYDEAWGATIPQELREAAARLSERTSA